MMMSRDKQQAHGRSREKLSLRNLLNIEPESHYQSVSLIARPQTMYTQRQLKMVTEDRGNLVTEKRMRRGMSQQIARGSSHQTGRLQQYQSVGNTEDRQMKQQLKHALGKVNLLASGDVVVDEEEQVRSIYLFLSALGRYPCPNQELLEVRTENFYKGAFEYISRSFDEIVYVKSLDWDRNQLQFIAGKTKSELLIKLFNGAREDTYKELADELYLQLGRQLQEGQEFQFSSSASYAELQGKLEEKNEVIRKLAGQINFYENQPSKEQFGYIAELEGKVAGLERELRQANGHIRELENSEDYLNQYTNMLNEKVEELRGKLYEFEIEQFSGLKEVEKNSDLKQFEQNVEVLKDLIHKGALSMATMRQEYNKVQAYNNQLIGERSVLAKRAAVGFAELTPRPNYRQIFKDHDLDMEQLIPEDMKPSTEELVSSLIKCFKDFYTKYVQKERLEVDPKELKKLQRKDPGKLILSELQKARKQMKRVEKLSIEVHSGYSKSKQEMQSKKK